MRVLKQSGTRPIFFLLVSSADHIAGLTGATATVTVSKDGAAFAAPAGAVAEVGNGWYKLTPTSADTGTLGSLLLHATATGADPVDDRYQVVSYDPEDAAALGLSRLDAAVSTRSTYAGADTAGTTTLLGRLTAARAGYLDNLNVSGLVATAAAVDAVDNFVDTEIAALQTDVTTLLARLSSARATLLDNLANLDATISSRSTYAGADTAGTTTLLARLTGARATLLDLLSNLDATVSSRLASAGYTAPPSASAVADQVWDEVIAGHLTGGTTGAALNGAGAAGDPWGTTLPGAYTAGSAGYIIGNRVDAAVSTRATAADLELVEDAVAPQPERRRTYTSEPIRRR